MEIRFYKDTLNEEQIIELIKLDNDFKSDGIPIIEYKEQIKGFDWWCDDSGAFNVYANEDAKANRNKSNYIRLFPYVKLNKKQLEYYTECILGKYKLIACPFYIVNNDEEKEQVAKVFCRNNIQPLYGYPFIIGNEEGFVFQRNYSETIKDYIDHQDKKIYKYQLIKLKSWTTQK